MDTIPLTVMDKKPGSRLAQLPTKNPSEAPVKEYGGKKSVPQYGRKREFDRPDSGRKPVAGRGGRSGQRYVRPREKMGGKVEGDTSVLESGSLYCAGGKKQNITHLLNWWGPNHRSQDGRTGGKFQGTGARVRRYSSHTPKYSKEHYLQANCQFVVDDKEDYSVYAGNQDLLVDWRFVEEVRLHVSEAPACPICLYPPTAAKVTRCGHIYCFACILHYLALSDKNWRKCPICYEPVDKEDLKSVVAIRHKEFGIGEEVELQLMRRERDSLLPMPAANFNPDIVHETPRISHPTATTPYTKLLIASKEEVQTHILSRELRDLEAQLLDEGEQPEACFIHEALALLRSRKDSLKSDDSIEDLCTKAQEGLNALSLSSPEEPSSADSFSSMDEPQSPAASALGAESFPLQAPYLDSGLEASGEDHDKSLVTVEDLDISQLQTVNNSSSRGQVPRNAPKSTFYFYQASNGAHVYMHALNVQMLVQEYGATENCPPIIKAKVVDKESVSMTEELRSRLRYLRHLPIMCRFDVVEVALGYPTVSKLTYTMFQDQIESRKRKRNKRAREERKIEKRVQEEEDRMMGRSKGATNIKIESLKQFPSFCDDAQFRASAEIIDGGEQEIEHQDYVADTNFNNEVLATSAESTGTGMSFAKMIREGHTKVPNYKSEPATMNVATGVWPTLGGPSSKPLDQAVPKRSGVGVSSKPWEIKSASKSSGLASQMPQNLGGSDDEEEGAPVPEFKHAFSEAIAKALDAATIKSAVKSEAEEVAEGGRKGKKKKKQKKVLLFSSGGLN